MTDENQGESPADGALPEQIESPAITDEAAEKQPTDDAGSKEAQQPRDEKGRFESVQKRIDQVTWEKHEERRQREAAERERDFLRAQLQQQAPKSAPLTKPTPEQFGFDDAKYQEARDEYTTRLAEAKAAEKVAEILKAHEEQQRAQKRQQSFAEKVAAFEKENPDYREAISDRYLPFEGELLDHILDVGPQLAYYLGKNPEVARAIAALPSVAMAREIGKIEAKFSAPKAAPQVTKAPAPPPKIAPSTDSGISVKPTEADSDKMSDAEWMAAREKQLRRKA